MAVSGLETIRKLLGVGELLCFESELLMCVRNGLHSHPSYEVRCLKSTEDMILALAGQFKQLSHEPEKFR